MSNKALNWAFEAPIDNAGAKFVLVVLADHGTDHSGERWTCFPSIERIQRFTSQGFRTVQRHLDWLEAEGWISRKRRPGRNGKQGVYDYTLHREREQAGEAPANLAGDSTGQSGATDRPKTTEAPANLAGAYIDDPSIEPPHEPCAGEADQDFEEVFEAWSTVDQFHTSRPKALAEWLQWAPGIGSARLKAAALRYLSGDPDVRRHGPKWLHKWLGEELWRPLLPREAGHGSATSSAMVRTPFAGPPELRAAVVSWMGEDWTASYVDPCAWDPEASTLIPRTGIARDRIRQEIGRALRDKGVSIADPQRPAQ